MEALTYRSTLYRIGWEFNEMTFENVTQMNQLFQVIYGAAFISNLPQRQLYAEVCDLLKEKSANETTFKRLLLSKCQVSFTSVLDFSISANDVVEFIGKLFNVVIFPGTILMKECVDKLMNQRMHDKVHALLMTAGSLLEAEMDENAQRYSSTMQQCLLKLEEDVMKPLLV